MHIRTVAWLILSATLLAACSDPRVRAESQVLDQVGIPGTYQLLNQYQEQDLAVRQYLAPPTSAAPAALRIPSSLAPFTPKNSLENYTKATGWKPLAQWLGRDSRDGNKKCLIAFELAVDLSKAFSPGLSKSAQQAVEAGRMALVRLTAGCD